MAQKSDHELVPVHELMTESEVKELLKSMHITPENLPKIYSMDPQAIKLGAKQGQIVRISRKEGVNSYLYYRVVVEG